MAIKTARSDVNLDRWSSPLTIELFASGAHRFQFDSLAERVR